MATQEPFPLGDQPSKLLDLIQKFMIAPVHDQIGAVKEEVNLAVRLAAEAELTATSTGRNLHDELSRLKSSLNTMGELFSHLAFSYYATRVVLMQWLSTSSVLATFSTMPALRDDLPSMLQLSKLSAEYLVKITEVADQAGSVNGPERVTELEDRAKTIWLDIVPRLRAMIPPPSRE